MQIIWFTRCGCINSHFNKNHSLVHWKIILDLSRKSNHNKYVSFLLIDFLALLNIYHFVAFQNHISALDLASNIFTCQSVRKVGACFLRQLCNIYRSLAFYAKLHLKRNTWLRPLSSKTLIYLSFPYFLMCICFAATFRFYMEIKWFSLKPI